MCLLFVNENAVSSHTHNEQVEAIPRNALRRALSLMKKGNAFSSQCNLKTRFARSTF